MKQILTLHKLPLNFRKNVIKHLPNIARPVISLVPMKVQEKLLLPALNSVFKEALEDGDFAFLTGKWLKINVADLDINWWLSFQDNRLVMASAGEAITEDVSFSANGDDLILIASRKQDPDTLFFQRRLKIEGDTELGLEVKNLIDAIDIDQLPSTVHSVVEHFAALLETTKHEMSIAQTA